MHHLRLGFLILATATFVSGVARAQVTVFDVICTDGTAVPGSADSTACASHGGAHTIVARRGTQAEQAAQQALQTPRPAPVPPSR